jgi:hypothetical protein
MTTADMAIYAYNQPNAVSKWVEPQPDCGEPSPAIAEAASTKG